MNDWLVVGSQYSCAPSISLSQSGLVLSRVGGRHQPGRINENVVLLAVYFQTVVNRIPRKIDEFFPKIRGFQWFGGSLESVSAEDFNQFPQLVVLNIQRNKLMTLDSDLFLNTPLLELVEFSENSIESIGPDLLTNLDRLKNVFLEHNICVNRNAYNREDVLELIRILPFLCPINQTTNIPSTIETTTVSFPGSEECSAGCLETIDVLESQIKAETAELKREVGSC